MLAILLSTADLLAHHSEPIVQKPDIAVIIMDDVGIDVLEQYSGTRTDPPPEYLFPETPNIDEIEQHGVQFQKAWVTPWCSPSRSGVNAGREGWRTGIGKQIIPDQDESLPLTEKTIPEMLSDSLGDSAYICAAIAK
jgi:arylsulfatase A-like enzyme